MGVDVRAVRRDRVRRGQRGPDAAGRGQGRAGHDAAAPGREGPAGHARAVRGQQGGRAGRVRGVRRGRGAPAARVHGTGPAVAVGQHRRDRPRGRGRTKGGNGLAGGLGQRTSAPVMTMTCRDHYRPEAAARRTELMQRTVAVAATEDCSGVFSWWADQAEEQLSDQIFIFFRIEIEL